MSILSILGISNAYASTATSTAMHHPTAMSGLMSMLPMLLIIGLFIFFMMRPQMKRSKEHRTLMENIAVGDEVMTTGGIVGRITRLRDNFIVLTIAKDIEVTMQKHSIASVLPKGTLESI